MSKQEPGYIYRCAGLSAGELQGMFAAVFDSPQPIWAFASNSVTLHAIQPYAGPSDIPLQDKQQWLTEGHAFTATVEVRWKRRDGAYDVLVLTENDQIAGKLPEVRFTATYDTRRPKKESPEKEAAKEAAYLVLATPRDVQARRQEWRLGYVEYRDPDSGAVQLVRYTERIERPRSR